MHEVSIARFALGKYPVTRGEFAAFVSATGYRTDAERNVPVLHTAPGYSMGETPGCTAYDGSSKFGWRAGTSWRNVGFAQDDTHPAICLSWNDAHAYAEWLAQETGKPYRLPSEAEMEYAIRAGTTGRYPWGADANQACRYANITDASGHSKFPLWTGAASCDDGYVFTSPVGHFAPNAFGLYDTIGNVQIWAEDCYSFGYIGAPADGSANTGSGCKVRVLRGASWGLGFNFTSSFRSGSPPEMRLDRVGARVAESL